MIDVTPRLIGSLKKIGAIIVLAFLVAFGVPRHTETRLQWGFPFVNRFEVKEAFIFPGQEEAARGFDLVMLIWDIWLLFVVIMIIWFIAGSLYYKMRQIVDNLS